MIGVTQSGVSLGLSGRAANVVKVTVRTLKLLHTGRVGLDQSDAPSLTARGVMLDNKHLAGP
jgi:hypothetical protein